MSTATPVGRHEASSRGDDAIWLRSAKSANPRPQEQNLAILLGKRTRVRFPFPPPNAKGPLFRKDSGLSLFRALFLGAFPYLGQRDSTVLAAIDGRNMPVPLTIPYRTLMFGACLAAQYGN
ncbi:hypothetical protein [Burkholderia gladioli]|uniref:hypothetical protein n=1 Tax=Burkholderia gladioli TaxID=28095 RepID=UPI00164063FD|nr:hypothetical protein [Burkholderia gladioli]